MKKLILLTLIIAGLTAFKSNTTRHITGAVYGSDNKLPIIGAIVKIKGTTTNVVTNQSGRYILDVPDGNRVLVVSYIGYQTKTLAIGKNDSLDVYLDPSNSTLNEVVIIGYQTKQKRDVTGSVTTVSPNADISKPVLSAPVVQYQANQLAGKVAGVAIYTPGAATYKSPAGGLAADKSLKYAANVPYNNNTFNPADESYKTINENGFSNAKDNPLSTFSVDVDAASYSNVRRFINNGLLPPVDAVRVEEMINYFKYNLAGPSNGEPVGITTETSSAPWNQKHLLVRIGLKARTIDMSKLPASNLVFLLDISGSMGEANKLPLVKASMKMLVDQLRAEDRVAIVVYSGQVALKLPSTSGNEKQKIKDAIDDLQAGGSTAGGAGIKMAYRIARENFVLGGKNRIIMATDGDFNVGDSSDGDMETLITRERYSKVPITIMGFGMGNLKDSKMVILADKGNGNYAYIDNLTEARKTLVSEYGGTMYMVAKDVKLQVEF